MTQRWRSELFLDSNAEVIRSQCFCEYNYEVGLDRVDAFCVSLNMIFPERFRIFNLMECLKYLSTVHCLLASHSELMNLCFSLAGKLNLRVNLHLSKKIIELKITQHDIMSSLLNK